MVGEMLKEIERIEPQKAVSHTMMVHDISLSLGSELHIRMCSLGQKKDRQNLRLQARRGVEKQNRNGFNYFVQPLAIAEDFRLTHQPIFIRHNIMPNFDQQKGKPFDMILCRNWLWYHNQLFRFIVVGLLRPAGCSTFWRSLAHRPAGGRRSIGEA